MVFDGAYDEALETILQDQVSINNYGNSFLPSGVKEVQKALIFNGFRIKDDGIFGPATKEAVIQFQKKKGIKQTGNVGPITAKALGVQPLTSATNQKLPTTATNKPKVNVNAKVAPSKEDSWWDKTKNFCSSPVKRMEEFKQKLSLLDFEVNFIDENS